MSRLMHIGLLFQPLGNHPASWLVADAQPGAEVSIDHYIRVAKIAEAGALDFVFFADVPAIRDGNMAALKRWPIYAAQLEPLTLLGALATATTRIGLAATASTSYAEPYNMARQFASLDHLSKGRVGWNVVTTTNPAAAFNYGSAARRNHADRYARAHEFLAIVKGLWDSWEDDAFPRDPDKGIFFDPDKLHRLDFTGEYFHVRGPLNVPRPPQGHPVILQAGGSEAGRELAAETAEVVFTVDRDLNSSMAFYTDLKSRLERFGRTPDQLKILSGLNPFVGRTKSEAEDRFATFQAKIHPDVGRELLSVDLTGIDLSDVPIDSPIPRSKIPEHTEGGKSYFGHLRKLVDGGTTLRELYLAHAAARGALHVVGTAADVADIMQEWFDKRAADGFMIGLSALPGDARDFVDLVVPELRRRGLFRHGYDGVTLREHLGLKRPPNRHAAQA